MKSIEALEKARDKELELAEKHKKKAADIEKELEMKKGKMTVKAVNALNLSGQQYDRFLKLLSNKKTVLEAVELMNKEDETETDKQYGGEESGTEEGKKENI